MGAFGGLGLPTLPFLDTRRQLAVLRAQMSAAGLAVG